MREDRGYYKDGDYYISDDITGWKTRQSDAKKQWDGLLVDKHVYTDRQPQDFVRGLKDDIAVRNARPPPPATYIGPKATVLTADAVAGATALTIESSTGFRVADKVAVMLDDGDRFLGTIATVPGATGVTLTAPLPWASSAGKQIINQTNVVAPNIG